MELRFHIGSPLTVSVDLIAFSVQISITISTSRTGTIAKEKYLLNKIGKYRHISKCLPLHSFFYISNLGGLYLTDMFNMIHAYGKLPKEVRTFYKIKISVIEKKLSHFN